MTAVNTSFGPPALFMGSDSPEVASFKDRLDQVHKLAIENLKYTTNHFTRVAAKAESQFEIKVKALLGLRDSSSSQSSGLFFDKLKKIGDKAQEYLYKIYSPTADIHALENQFKTDISRIFDSSSPTDSLAAEFPDLDMRTTPSSTSSSSSSSTETFGSTKRTHATMGEEQLSLAASRKKSKKKSVPDAPPSPMERPKRRSGLPKRFIDPDEAPKVSLGKKTLPQKKFTTAKTKQQTPEQRIRKLIESIDLTKHHQTVRDAIESQISASGARKQFSWECKGYRNFDRNWAQAWLEFKGHDDEEHLELKTIYQNWVSLRDRIDEMVAVVDTKDKLLGNIVLARAPIKKGTCVALYSGNFRPGKRVDHDSEHAFQMHADKDIYEPLFQAMGDFSLDGQNITCHASCLSHNDDFNVDTRLYCDEEGPKILLVTNEDIPAGAVLSINYGDSFWDDLGITPIRITGRAKV